MVRNLKTNKFLWLLVAILSLVVPRSILISSLLFGSLHLVNLLTGAPFADVLTQTIFSIILGFFMAAVVLYAKSIWPAVVVHGLIDAAAHLNVIGKPDLDTTLSDLLLLVATTLPVGVYGLYLIRRVEMKPVIPETP